MKFPLPLLLFCLFASTFVWATSSYGSNAEETQNKADRSDRSDQANRSSALLKGQAAAFGVLSEDIQARMGFQCVNNQDEEVVVADVRPGTAAFNCQLQKGDLILDAQLKGNALDITIQRHGKIFRARLRELTGGNPVFVAQKAKLDSSLRKPFTLRAEQAAMQDNRLVPEKSAQAQIVAKPRDLVASQFSLQSNQNCKLLADYNLELIVDRSMSMRKPDCPGGLSRWQWLGTQAADLANSLAPYVPNGMTIIPFATEYDVFEHATAKHIDYLFNSLGLQFGTRLFEPLAERLDNYFVHYTPSAKPLLIVVITDGIPFPRFEPELVRTVLIEASQKMISPEQVTVIFCQIGGQDRFGERFLFDLDQNLLSYGARYHFVHTISFDDLQDKGLGPSLVSSIKQYAPIKHTESPQVKVQAFGNSSGVAPLLYGKTRN